MEEEGLFQGPAHVCVRGGALEVSGSKLGKFVFG